MKTPERWFTPIWVELKTVNTPVQGSANQSFVGQLLLLLGPVLCSNVIPSVPLTCIGANWQSDWDRRTTPCRRFFWVNDGWRTIHTCYWTGNTLFRRQNPRYCFVYCSHMIGIKVFKESPINSMVNCNFDIFPHITNK